jgi:hypothetical protein
MTGKTRRYTMSEMRYANKAAGQYFFEKATMKHFSGASYRTRYDKETGQNYIGVGVNGRTSWYRFYPSSGHLNYVRAEDVPTKIREK